MRADTLTVRLLSDADRDAMCAFLTRHVASSMFLLGNARAQGLDYSGRPQSGQYWAVAESGGAIRGVLSHCWNGNVLIQAPDPEARSVLLDGFQSAVSRPVAGALGDDDQVQAAAKAYEAVGFERIGTYRIALLRDPVSVG